MNIELILLGVIGVVFLLDFILNSIKKKSVVSSDVGQFEGSKPLSKKGGLHYILNRKKNISLAIFLVPVIKLSIHYLVYPIRVGGGPKNPFVLFGERYPKSNASLGRHIDVIFTDELWLFLPALFLVLFVSWFFSDKIKAR